MDGTWVEIGEILFKISTLVNFLIIYWWLRHSDRLIINAKRFHENCVSIKDFIELYDKVKELEYHISELKKKSEPAPQKEKRAYKKNIWLSTLEATKLLKLPHSTVIRWSKEGYIPYKKSGKKKFIYRQKDLLALNIKEIREKNALEQKKRLLGQK